jgi:hypothetical protein
MKFMVLINIEPPPHSAAMILNFLDPKDLYRAHGKNENSSNYTVTAIGKLNCIPCAPKI